MLKINNKERVIEEEVENKIENIFNIILNLADKVLDYVEEKHSVCPGRTTLFFAFFLIYWYN